MSKDFEGRLCGRLPEIIERFGTPFHIYDEAGIMDTCVRLKEVFRGIEGFQEYFAVKALPNPHVMKIFMRQGFGLDCSSSMELELAEYVGAYGEHIMFTSNNTEECEFVEASDCGAIINIDDISMVSKVPAPFPELICFRYNPGPERTGNAIIGNPVEAKYGITKEQLVPAYKAARERGAKRFGIHTMVCSNELNFEYMVETVNMLLKLSLTLRNELGITCEFINMGGGIGIPYKPEDKPFDLEELGLTVYGLLHRFRTGNGFAPKLFMESGRYMTGPHGVLVSRVINRKEIYQTHIGVDAGMEALARHGIYGAYHHATVLDSQGRFVSHEERGTEVVNIVGSMCENNDRLATQRELPRTVIGDIMLTHDTGAHGLAMTGNYNSRLRPQELFLREDGSVLRIRRAENNADLWRTLDEI